MAMEIHQIHFQTLPVIIPHIEYVHPCFTLAPKIMEVENKDLEAQLFLFLKLRFSTFMIVEKEEQPKNIITHHSSYHFPKKNMAKKITEPPLFVWHNFVQLGGREFDVPDQLLCIGFSKRRKPFLEYGHVYMSVYIIFVSTRWKLYIYICICYRIEQATWKIHWHTLNKDNSWKMKDVEIVFWFEEFWSYKLQLHCCRWKFLFGCVLIIFYGRNTVKTRVVARTHTTDWSVSSCCFLCHKRWYKNLCKIKGWGKVLVMPFL